MKTIGVIGGIGWEGSAMYYRVMNRAVRSRLGGWNSARIVLDSLEFNAIAQAQSRADFLAVRESLVQSGKRLEAAGADVLVIACNTVHRFAPAVSAVVKVPLLHIADAAGQALQSDGHRRVGLLGTRATVEGAFYPTRFERLGGIELVIPKREVMADVDDLIMGELALRTDDGPVSDECGTRMGAAVAHLAEAGCSAVLLACTEFGLVYGARDRVCIQQQLPLYDTGVVHALAAVDWALA